MKALTKLQNDYLRGMGVLLAKQLVLLMVVVLVMTKTVPNIMCLFTCTWWIDFLVYIAIGFTLIWVAGNHSYSHRTRLFAFYGIGVLMSYLLGVQYNVMRRYNKKKDTARNFLVAVACTVGATILVVLLLPYLLPHISLLVAISSVLFVGLVVLIFWGFFVQKQLVLWLTASLVIFLGLLVTDMTMLVYACKKNCDALDGATLLYIDLMNILQKIFLLLQQNNH